MSSINIPPREPLELDFLTLTCPIDTSLLQHIGMHSAQEVYDAVADDYDCAVKAGIITEGARYYKGTRYRRPRYRKYFRFETSSTGWVTIGVTPYKDAKDSIFIEYAPPIIDKLSKGLTPIIGENLDSKAWKALLSRAKVTRLDLATNFPGLYLGQLHWDFDYNRDSERYKTNGHLSGVSIGSRRSDNQTVIYDSECKKQRGKPWNPAEACCLRLEWRRRNICKDYKLELADVPTKTVTNYSTETILYELLEANKPKGKPPILAPEFLAYRIGQDGLEAAIQLLKQSCPNAARRARRELKKHQISLFDEHAMKTEQSVIIARINRLLSRQ